MTNPTFSTTRAGYSDAPQGTEQVHTLIVVFEDRTGTLDRVVGVLRRKRARVLSLSLRQTETPEIVQITTQIKDSEVGIDQLVEQMRKIVDVHAVLNLGPKQAISRALVLVKVSTQTANAQEILASVQQFGATLVRTETDAIILEATGDETQLANVINALQSYSVREIARSGSAALKIETGQK